MNSSHEPSFYEIALTNRQVLFAFVVLLVCLLGAFVAGIWVGRGGAPTATVARADVGPAEAARPAGVEMERLSFFGDGEGAAARPAPADTRPAAPPAAGRPETTLTQDLGVDPTPHTATDAEAEPPPAAREPEPEPEREPEPTPRRAEPPAQTPARTPPAQAPAQAPPQTAPARTAPPPAAEPAAGDLYVQVFSTRERDQADKVLARLRGAGEAATLSPVDVSGQTMYRVRVGPFKERPEAQKVADRIRKNLKLDTWITQ